MDMGHGMGGTGPKCKISMLWNWDVIDTCFLASSWHVTSTPMFALSCIGVILLVICLEALRRICKEYDNHVQRTLTLSFHQQQQHQEENHPKQIQIRITLIQQLIRSLLFAITFGVAYIIMLLAMYFNGYIIISIIIGAALGKFFCDWMTWSVVTVGSNVTSNSVASNSNAIKEPTICCG